VRSSSGVTRSQMRIFTFSLQNRPVPNWRLAAHRNAKRETPCGTRRFGERFSIIGKVTFNIMGKARPTPGDQISRRTYDARRNGFSEQLLPGASRLDARPVPKPREMNPELDAIAERLVPRACGALAANIREKRIEHGLTQEALAEATGHSVIYVRQLERAGTENPTLRVLVLLAHALSCSLPELLRPRPAPKPSRPGRPRARKPSPSAL
jgi:DNA-binding XRE family transcriptional regulator